MRRPHPAEAPIAVLRAAWLEYQRDRASYLATAMIYYALVSLVPVLLLVAGGLGLALRFSPAAGEARDRLLVKVVDTFGASISEALAEALDALSRGSFAATAISLAGLLVAASALFRNLRLTFRALWRQDPPIVAGDVRSVIRQTVAEQLLAFAMVLGGGALLLGAVAIVAVTQQLVRALGDAPWLGWVGTAVSSFALAALAFGPLLKVLPPVQLRWRDVAAATVLCSAGWVVASELLALYGALAGTGAYGILGGLLAVMLWMNLVSKVLFFGAELCKVVALRRGEPPQRRIPV